MLQVHGYSLLRPILNIDYFHDLFDVAADFGVEVEGHRECLGIELGCKSYIAFPDTETGPGVFESALGYTDASRMADNAVLFKLVAKSVGIKYGIIPTFMAKPWGDVS